MRRVCSVAALALLFCVPLRSQENTLQRAAALEVQGHFSEAASALTEALSGENDPKQKSLLAFELDRLRRIRLDYPYTQEEVWKQVQRAVRDVTQKEFEEWIVAGRFDIRIIDGDTLYNGVSRSNLFWRYPDIVARRINPPDNRAFEQRVWTTAQEITAAAKSSGTPYVLPKTFSVTMKVTASANAAPANETIRAWLPIPRAFPFQTGFRLISSSSPASVDRESSPIRSAYMEQPSVKDKPTVFSVEYEYSHYGIRFDVDASRVQPYDPDDPVVRDFTGEGPHIQFTDAVRALSKEIAGSTDNPLVQAKAFYDWISEHIQYSYALEYSTIRNISDYCLTKRYGDCGQEALLFITLCRLNGIPARWQSAWFTFPGGKTIHDWTEIYVRPWGWMPVDPYMGIFAMQYLKSLTPEERRGVRDFYFGGLDQYRMAANSDHCQNLMPAKAGLRSDNVDFQRGELEAKGENIYFDKYSYSLDVKELFPTP
ncbi:MAG: hypothetical protein A3H45_13760 [Ignavibacteria bacterium RIFCSPLOWO2_02_FULL_55_14]|nr:MAG: hypothetical protein A3H45_13760 [Ignavibacteria bacterium RIFCSPLOWO2_02_FULL_55_14]